MQAKPILNEQGSLWLLLFEIGFFICDGDLLAERASDHFGVNR